MTLLTPVNPLAQQEDSLIQKAHLTSELLEANTLELYEGKMVWGQEDICKISIYILISKYSL